MRNFKIFLLLLCCWLLYTVGCVCEGLSIVTGKLCDFSYDVAKNAKEKAEKIKDKE